MYEMEREKAEKETSDLRRSQAVTPDFSEKIRTFFGPGVSCHLALRNAVGNFSFN